MSGMISGMDTEALVQAMVATQVAKKEKYQKAQTKLEWKQDAFKAINTKVYGLFNKVSSLRFTSAYSMKKTTVSDKTKATVTASGDAINGTQTLAVKNLAKSGYLTGAKLEEGTTSKSTLADLGYAGGETTITVRTGSKNRDITVSGETKISDLVSELNKSGVKASFDEKNGRFFVSASETGKSNDFSLTASSMSGLQALSSVGLSTATEANMAAYKANAAYALGTMGVDASGEVKSYFQLDEKGNIKFDKSGNPLVNEGVTFSTSKTQESIEEILKNLKEAKESIAKAKADKNTLNEKIAYSEAKDAVNDFLEGVPEDKKDIANQLLTYLKEEPGKYKYVDENGDVVNAYDNEQQAGKTSLEDKVKALGRELGIITETDELDDNGKKKEDLSVVEKLYANVQKTLTVDANEIYTAEDKAAYYISKDDREAAKADDGALQQYDDIVEQKQEVVDNAKNQYWDLGDYTDMDDAAITAKAAEITEKITMAKNIVMKEEGYTLPVNSGAVKVDAEDAEITLNGATFTSSTNTFNVNGLTIQATAKTADGEEITINTDVDTQGIYDKIKDFLSEYNEVMKELCKLYNADSAKGYEPLTDDEKEEMSDSEVEKWETKVKDALLRRDSTIGGIINSMNSSMQKMYTINGKNYSLSSLGIHTMGFLNSAKNENYAYHIDGDSDDSVTSGNADKLMNMIQNNPEDTIDFLKQLTTGLYDELNTKMKSTSMSSAYTIYADKQMTKDIDSYKKLVKTWEEKVQDMEDRYYKQFSKMETQLSKLQSSTSSLSSLFGTGQ